MELETIWTLSRCFAFLWTLARAIMASRRGHPVSDYQPVTRVKKTQHSPSFFLFRLEGALIILAMNRFAARSLTENSLPKLYFGARNFCRLMVSSKIFIPKQFLRDYYRLQRMVFLPHNRWLFWTYQLTAPPHAILPPLQVGSPLESDFFEVSDDLEQKRKKSLQYKMKKT